MSTLDEIEARANAATDGPWYVERDEFDFPVVTVQDGLTDNAVTVADDMNTENAEFIAHARTDTPALVALVRDIKALAEEWDDNGYSLYGDLVARDIRAVLDKYLGSER